MKSASRFLLALSIVAAFGQAWASAPPARSDDEPRRLMIYVRQSARESSENQGTSASGTVGGARWAVTNEAGGATDRRGVTVRASRSSSESSSQSEQMIQAIEGSPASIAIGQSQPTVTRTQGPGGAITETVTFGQSNTGVEVVARIVGRRVILEIHSEGQRIRADGGRETQRLTTTVAGKLGEWFSLGGSSRKSAGKVSGSLARAVATNQELNGVWVKVEALK